ncbi:acetyl-CoA C-acetyltransferase [Propionibacterium cyclohexanicum]|uniref:Acetyl-CoA C-acetyltransferase n=1 Tax=Propionibacterium cyclohexanicum TaxID=64702 RepID=A0A1H9SNX6_9ACTN|nr:thiolase family protein [Propionibacterium cyclohexanicum]SER86578.1 acetyl-CoA C-acetyltransferase [Propionibacterium cyclohexanicum]
MIPGSLTETDDRSPVIIGALRTPIGNRHGIFRELDTTALAAPVIGALAAQLPAGLEPSELVLGNVRGPGGNPARVAALAAGLDPRVAALTVDRQCGSGMAALEYAWHRCRSMPGVVLAGGVQAVSTQPLTAWPPTADSPARSYERAPFAPPPWNDPEMGLAADLLAEEHGIGRERQDAYALRSHQRAVTARQAGVFAAETVDIAGHHLDERPRWGFTAARLARFPPQFRTGGTVTAASSCGVSDGAAALVMVDAATHARIGVPGLRVLGCVTAGCDPDRPGWGIVPAVQGVLEHTGVGLDEISVVELNEAFAGQVLACADGLGLDERRICPDGGAIGLGHPWAASGAILLVRLFSALVRSGRGGYGLAAIAIGGGQGSAMLVQACSLTSSVAPAGRSGEELA